MYEVSSRLRPFGGNTSLNEKLMAHWTLDDDTNNTHYADSLGRIPGKLISTTGKTTHDLAISGLQGGAVSFNGVDHIDLQSAWDLIDFEYNAPLSIFFVVKRISGTTNIYNLFSTREGTTDKGIVFLVISTTGAPYLMYKTNASNWIRVRTTVGLPLNTWALAGFTYDGSGTKEGLTCYLNDTPYIDYGFAGTLSSVATNSAAIGDEKYASTYLPFTGGMQLFSAWQKELNQQNVTDLYAEGAILPC